jgi:hypothetical protein
MTNEKSMGSENLVDKILFLSINCKRFGNVRTSKVELNTTANQSWFHTNKKLLKSPELSAIALRDAAIKKSILPYLLPYKVGVAILPAASGLAVREILEAYEKVERPALVKSVVDAYVTRIEEAKAEQKEEFQSEQYKDISEVAGEFSFDYDIWSLSLPADMKDAAHAKIMAAADGIADALAQAAYTLTSKLADSLSSNDDGTAKKIYDKQFVKLQEFLAGFDIRNVVNNAELKAEMDILKELVNGVDPEQVRNNDGLRVKLAEKMTAATKALTVMIQPAGRMFRDPAEAVI